MNKRRNKKSVSFEREPETTFDEGKTIMAPATSNRKGNGMSETKKLQANFLMMIKMLFQRNQAVTLFSVKMGLLLFRTKRNTFPKVNLVQEKWARNFPDSRNIRIGAQQR
jgi:hypothetical protein